MVVGLDLAGSPNRTTGFCLLTSGRRTRTSVLHETAEILEATRRARPDLVIIDAPLSLPLGRPSLERVGPPHLRQCDRDLLRLGIRFFPLTLGPMRVLTARGIAMKGELERTGLSVVEGYPGGTQDLMGWPRKGKDACPLQRALRRFGFRGDVVERSLSHDELDAISCAWAGWEYLRGRARILGDPREGLMVLATAQVSGREVAPPLARARLTS